MDVIAYLKISVYSYPAIAVYNSGTALYCSICKTAIIMKISMFSNLINIIVNIISVFVLKAGIEGVAYPSLISRVFYALAI